MATKKKFQPIVLGDKGPAVKECQQLLRKAGSSIKATGEFTIGMLSAVKSFQKKNKLEATGKIDAKTFLKLSEFGGKKK